jgi:hypothetical protein
VSEPIGNLLPGLGTVVLALFGGAAGSALLELWWKPRRTRRRVAALLAHEVNINGQMLVLHTHLRKRKPRQISKDFQLSHLAFDAVAQEIAELPPKVASHVIVVYHRFDHLERLREWFSEALEKADAAESGAESEKLRQHVLATLDAFNLNLDKTLNDARETFGLLRALAPKQEWREVSDAEYGERVAASEAERLERLKRLDEMGP